MPNPVIKAKRDSKLIYLKELLDQTLEYSLGAYEQYKIPNAFLPSAGKEIAFTPLLVAAAYNKGFYASTEIQVEREGKSTKGRLDMALFSRRNGRRAELLELKAKRYIITTGNDVALEKIKDGIKKAKKQLNSITSVPEMEQAGKIAVVVQNIICPDSIAQSIEEWSQSKDDYEEKLDRIFEEITNEMDNSLVGMIKWPGPHPVNASRNKYSSIGMIVVLQRIE